MPVLIDGNNLLYAAQADPRGPDALGRFGLSRMLGEWSERTGQRVTIVFDGTSPPRDLAGQLGDPRIRVIYSGAGVTADARIAELLDRDSAARRMLVVSSDREVQAEARRRRASAIRSEDFVAKVRREMQSPRGPAGGDDPAEKTRGLEADGLDAWLEEFGLDSSGSPPLEHP